MRFLKKLVTEFRILDGRKEKTSFIIIDAQSVKNTDTAKNKHKPTNCNACFCCFDRGIDHVVSGVVTDAVGRVLSVRGLYDFNAEIKFEEPEDYDGLLRNISALVSF